MILLGWLGTDRRGVAGLGKARRGKARRGKERYVWARLSTKQD